MKKDAENTTKQGNEANTMLGTGRLITHDDFLSALQIVNSYKNQIETHYKEVQSELKTISRFAGITKNDKFEDICNDVRLLNIVRGIFYNTKINHWDITIENLSMFSIQEYKNLRMCGKKSIDQLKEICFYAGIILQEQ